MWRSLQFIPASNEKMLAKARESPADALIFDLEDSVAAEGKERARSLLTEFLSNYSDRRRGIIVRINSFDSFGNEDLQELAHLEAIDAILLPKATVKSVNQLDALLCAAERKAGAAEGKFKIIALIETAAAVLNAYSIAAASARMIGMLFGAEDFTTQMGLERTNTGEEFYVARSLHAIACKAAGIQAFDTPFPDTKDLPALAADTIAGKKLGMTGKSAIHPIQVETIHRFYTPSPAEVERARIILEAGKLAQEEGKGVFAVEGKMVDAPVVQRAASLLALYESIVKKQETKSTP